MGKTFCKHICHICKQQVTSNGMGKAAHYRGHVLKGLCVEMDAGQLYWTPKGVPLDKTDSISIWQRDHMTELAKQMVQQRKINNK